MTPKQMTPKQMTRAPMKGGRIGLWALATIAALALHVGAAGAGLAWLSAGEGDDEAGAIAETVALEVAAPQNEEMENLTPGPVAQESSQSAPAAAANQEMAQKAAQDAPDAPESEDGAPKKVEEKKTEQAVQSAAAQASVAAQASAPPPNPDAVAKAPTSSAPVLGKDPAVERTRANWLRKLVAHLERAKRYPAGEKATGAARVAFRIDAMGHIQDARLVAASGHAALDAAALATLRRADPAPVPPPAEAARAVTYEMPILFRQRAR
jgi:TonB family protein